nr:hypothetical protein [Tanacetum cinerariifolium]
MSFTIELSKPYDCKVTIGSRPSTIPFIKERLKLSKSIDLNLVFDIAGYTLLFGRRLFPDKAKKLENKASLGKAAQGKAAKGKAAIGKATKEIDEKSKARLRFWVLVVYDSVRV